MNLLEEIEDYKKDHLATIRKMLQDNGMIYPTVSLLVLDKLKNKTGIVLAPISVGSSDIKVDKQTLKDRIIPELAQELADKDFELLCFSFSSEAYLRKLDLKDTKGLSPKELIDKAKKVDPREVLMVMFETEKNVSAYTSDIRKEGKVVNSEGDMIDNIITSEYEQIDDSSDKEPILFNAFKIK